MLLEVPVLGEGPIAMFANEGFFSSMNSHMVEEVPGLSEDFAAVIVCALENPSYPSGIRILFDDNFKVVRRRRVWTTLFERLLQRT